MSKKKKVRVDLRKNRTKPPRDRGWTRGFEPGGDDDSQRDERVRARGDLSRKRTIMQEDTSSGQASDGSVMPAIDTTVCRPGRVLRIHGLFSVVESDTGTLYRCALRRLLRSLSTDERNVLACGDKVWFRLSGPEVAEPVEPVEVEESSATGLTLRDLPEGMIERVEPRHGVLKRASRRREHVLVANIDQLLIVMSLFEPDLKPHLIDRYLASALQGDLKPIICLNKADLADPAAFQPIIGAYWQLGIPTILTSAKSGLGVEQLREVLCDRATVFSGQSGVGKSSLLNAIQPGLALRVKSVSEVNQKGRHTTTTSQLLRLESGGWVVDTPGVRQLQLWDTVPEEVARFFPDFSPFLPLCSFPDCTHTHEVGCAVKRAVRFRQISERRYTSYLGMFAGTGEE